MRTQKYTNGNDSSVFAPSLVGETDLGHDLDKAIRALPQLYTQCHKYSRPGEAVGLRRRGDVRAQL